MKAILKNARTSTKKATIVAKMIQGKSVVEALDILKFTPKKTAKLLYKVLHSAVSNAETNDSKKREDLIIDHVLINKGGFMKRFLPSTRGRALPIHKPLSHISVFLKTK